MGVKAFCLAQIGKRSFNWVGVSKDCVIIAAAKSRMPHRGRFFGLQAARTLAICDGWSTKGDGMKYRHVRIGPWACPGLAMSQLAGDNGIHVAADSPAT